MDIIRIHCMKFSKNIKKTILKRFKAEYFKVYVLKRF